jgi:hypothetical protein
MTLHETLKPFSHRLKCWWCQGWVLPNVATITLAGRIFHPACYDVFTEDMENEDEDEEEDEGW